MTEEDKQKVRDAVAQIAAIGEAMQQTITIALGKAAVELAHILGAVGVGENTEGENKS